MDRMNDFPEKNDQTPQVPPVPVGPGVPAVQMLFPTGQRELRFCAAILIAGILLANFVVYGGFNLGFAVMAVACVLCSAVYLLSSGRKISAYSGTLLGLSLVIGGSFLRSDDAFVKFVMLCFLLLSVNLGFCLMAGQNLRSAAGIASLLDGPRALFALGIGKLDAAFRGVKMALKQAGAAGKKRGAMLVGLLIAVPVLAVLIPLLMSADAAFEGLLNMLPEIDFSEIIASLLLGGMLAGVLYTRGVALIHNGKPDYVPTVRRGVNRITLNTVLAAVCGVYVVYLLSQLAYFAGGFSGILPEGYTMAQYARRGFFEMAWLSAINLTLMTLAVGLVEKKDGIAPLSTRLLCLFVGVVTLVFVATASAKMLLYIGAYGLTRLRVLTEVIMVFLALTTVIVSIWLFRPKLPYMKAVLVTALVMGAAVAWADVDTVVAAYNVNAYETGRLKTVDVYYLGNLGYGAAPYIHELTDSADPDVAASAGKILKDWARFLHDRDLREWNIAAARAWEFCEEYYIPPTVDS